MPGGVVVTRSLKHELRFDCLDDAAFDRLRFIDTRPSMPSTSLTPVDIGIRANGGEYSLSGPGIASDCAPGGLLDASHAIIRDILVEETRDGLLLHAASMHVGGKNVALLGDKGAGKTTLTLKALAAGHAVFGDEHIFIDRDCAMTRPRTLRIKQGSLALVPEIAADIRKCPSFTNWDGTEIYSLAPGNARTPWRLTPYAIDHAICLTPNHGSPSRIEEMDRQAMFSVAMEQSFLPPENQGGALAHLWKAVSAARAWKLELGDLDQAISLIEKLP